MGKYFALYKLGIKYLYRYMRRYGFLLTALIFGFAVVTLITSLKDGMYENVYYSAQAHYAGDIVAVGINRGFELHHLGEEEINAVINAAYIAGINPIHTVKRTSFGDRGILFFHGNAVLQRYVIGTDWENEAHLVSRMNFTSFIEHDNDENWIIISAPVASRLGAAAGDNVTLQVNTRWGQVNTGNFVIKGIIDDASIFGFLKVYVPRITLNRLLLIDDNDCSSIGFFLNNRANAERYRRRMHGILKNDVQTAAIVHDRDELAAEKEMYWNGTKVFLLTLPVYLSEISELIGAMNIVTYFLFVMMLIIILISAIVTYRLIIHERAKEIGIMRAIGFYGFDIRLVLWAEVISLGIISILGGFFLSWFLGRTISLIDFTWFPSLEIFMRNGQITALYLPQTVFINVLLTFFVLIIAVLFPSFAVSRKHLPSLLQGETI